MSLNISSPYEWIWLLFSEHVEDVMLLSTSEMEWILIVGLIVG